jgi:hypothetical protein
MVCREILQRALASSISLKQRASASSNIARAKLNHNKQQQKKKEKQNMPKIRFTKENLLERKQLKAGWRKLKVKEISDDTPGKNDPDSITWPATFIVDGGDDDGVPIKHWFTEKQMGRLSEYIQCFTAGSVDLNKDYELKDTVGRSVMGYCEYDIKQGFNTIRDFKPVQKGANA